MADVASKQTPDHRQIGHELARRSGVNLARARPAAVRLWHARGLALIALVEGDHAEVERVMAPYRRNGEPHGSG